MKKISAVRFWGRIFYTKIFAARIMKNKEKLFNSVVIRAACAGQFLSTLSPRKDFHQIIAF